MSRDSARLLLKLEGGGFELRRRDGRPVTDADRARVHAAIEDWIREFAKPAPKRRRERAATSEQDDVELVERALLDVARTEPPGTLLYTGDVRAKCSLSLSKERFDAAALALRAAGRAQLYHHDHPFALTEKERADLVFSPGGGTHAYTGTYYNAIMSLPVPRRGPRRPPHE